MQLATFLRQSTAVTAIALGALAASSSMAHAGFYVQTNLVSDVPNLAALTDPVLKNSWGVSESPTSPFWVSDQATNASTLYSVTGGTTVSKVNINPPSGLVAIPTTAAGPPVPPQGPTGQVNNTSTSAFLVGNGGNGASGHFIFANLNGTISAWDTGATAFVQATTPGAVYTGLAINAAQSRLYAADSAGGKVDIFDSTFAPVNIAGAFTDSNLPTGFVPFNVQNIGGRIYVTYVPPGRPNDIAAIRGQGVVDVYDENGNLLQRLVTGSRLAAPWGLAMAPATFGAFAGDLLVGNFSFVASEINAFDPVTGALEGTIPVDVGAGNTPGGLWALSFGNGGAGGSPNVLYFTDGINGEANGLFGALTVPEPSSLLLLAPMLGLVALRRRSTHPGA